jgi:hypothetical protein
MAEEEDEQNDEERSEEDGAERPVMTKPTLCARY